MLAAIFLIVFLFVGVLFVAGFLWAAVNDYQGR